MVRDHNVSKNSRNVNDDLKEVMKNLFSDEKPCTNLFMLSSHNSSTGVQVDEVANGRFMEIQSTSYGNKSVPSKTGKIYNHGNMRLGPKVHVSVIMNGLKYDALVDSGSTISAINSSVAMNLGDCLLRRIPVDGPMTQTAIAGEQQIIREMVEVKMILEGKSQKWRFYLIKRLATSVILGSDWMKSSKAILDVSKNWLSFEDMDLSETIESDDSGCHRYDDKNMKIRLANNVCIPEQSIRRVTVQGTPEFVGLAWLAPKREILFKLDVLAAHVLADLHNGKTDIWLTNLAKKSVHLHKGMVLCEANMLNECQAFSLNECSANNSNVDSLSNLNFHVTIGDQLRVDERKQLLAVIENFSDVFCDEEISMEKRH